MRKRRLRKFLIIVGTPFALFLMIILLADSAWVKGRLLEVVDGKLRAQFGVSISAGGSTLHLARLSLSLRDVRLMPVPAGRQAFERLEVVHVSGQIVKEQGRPQTIRVDNGPEFVSKDIDLWASWNHQNLDFSRPGKPTDNAYIESFNGRFRQECLNENWVLSFEDARERIIAAR